jgi:hypothetical protein
MIIKPTLKSGTQNLKRCKLQQDKDYAPPVIQKKQRLNNGFYSVAESEDLKITSVCGSGEGFNCGGGEIHSNSAPMELKAVTGKAPLLSRTSRGRVKKVPSKFNDSVLLDPRKNNGRINRSEFVCEDENSEIGVGFVNKGNENKFDSKTESDNGFDEFDYDKHAKLFKSVKTTVSGSRLSLVKTESEIGFDEKGKMGKEIYKLEDFGLGDIVWAKCGKSSPAWPAVVINPILQAPESVLKRCVPGAICVMFFGYSKNGNHRVSFLQ